MCIRDSFVTVKIRLHDIPDAIAVPTEAIVPEMGVDKVYPVSYTHLVMTPSPLASFQMALP